MVLVAGMAIVSSFPVMADDAPEVTIQNYVRAEIPHALEPETLCKEKSCAFPHSLGSKETSAKSTDR